MGYEWRPDWASPMGLLNLPKLPISPWTANYVLQENWLSRICQFLSNSCQLHGNPFQFALSPTICLAKADRIKRLLVSRKCSKDCTHMPSKNGLNDLNKKNPQIFSNAEQFSEVLCSYWKQLYMRSIPHFIRKRLQIAGKEIILES